MGSQQSPQGGRRISDRASISMFATVLLFVLSVFFYGVYAGHWDENYINLLGGFITLVGLFLQASRSVLPAWWKQNKTPFTESRIQLRESLNQWGHSLVLVGAAIIAGVYLAKFINNETSGGGPRFAGEVSTFMLESEYSQIVRGVFAAAILTLSFAFAGWLCNKLIVTPEVHPPKTVVSGGDTSPPGGGGNTPWNDPPKPSTET